jgi:hypothetical protein
MPQGREESELGKSPKEEYNEVKTIFAARAEAESALGLHRGDCTYDRTSNPKQPNFDTRGY